MRRSVLLEEGGQSVVAFRNALSAFLNAMQFDEHPMGGSWAPIDGRESEASSKRGEVDRLAGVASRIARKHGIQQSFKPPGSGSFIPFDVIASWADVVDGDSFSGLNLYDVFGTVDHLNGILDNEIRAARREERSLAGLLARIVWGSPS